ncbi:hypothetical protein PAPHI01_2131 [Pancytospora philotis]|nr:hypothetical protein PAPHI01_2131 [Pancytospora philotis]
MPARFSLSSGVGSSALDHIDDPAAVFEQYREDRRYLEPAVKRLVELQSAESLLKILEREESGIAQSTAEYQRVSEALLEAVAESRGFGGMDTLIGFFARLLAAQKAPFQTFLVARTVSALTARNGRFISRAQAARYFKSVAQLFKRAHSFYNYLNCMSILDGLEPVKMSSGEFEFLRKCATIKHEPACTELLCGLRPAALDELFAGKEFPPGEFKGIPQWNRLIEATASGAPVPFDIDFLGFLRKNGIGFTVDGDKVTVGAYEHQRVSARVFQIAAMYEPRVEREVVQFVPRAAAPAVKEPHPAAAPAVPEPEAPAPAAPEFANRFSEPYRRFKWLYNNASIAFADDCLEERNRLRARAFEERNAAHEAKRRLYTERRPCIERLAAELQQSVREKHEQERREALERQRILEEQEREERRKNLWVNNRAAAPPAPAAPQPSAWARRVDTKENANTSADASPRSDASSYVPPHLRK